MKRLRPSISIPVAAGLVLLAPAPGVADGIVVDRVYDPYVQQLETELEWRSILQYDENTPDLEKHLLGIGRSLSARWAAELYAIATREREDNLDLDVFELEFKWQLSEQGQYAIDWGAVFEIEHQFDEDKWEASASILAAHDFGRWTGLANLGLVYEWGPEVDNEAEVELRAQARYRLRETFEPAVELHMGQDTSVIGPALTGLYRISPGKSLRWEAGMFFAVDETSPDRVVKLNVEYEF